MINLLLRLSELGVPLDAVNAAAEEPEASVKIGYVVLAILIGPVIILSIASIFGHPRTYRIPGLFVGSVVLMIGAMVAVFLLGGALLKLIVPQ